MACIAFLEFSRFRPLELQVRCYTQSCLTEMLALCRVQAHTAQERSYPTPCDESLEPPSLLDLPTHFFFLLDPINGAAASFKTNERTNKQQHKQIPQTVSMSVQLT